MNFYPVSNYPVIFGPVHTDRQTESDAYEHNAQVGSKMKLIRISKQKKKCKIDSDSYGILLELVLFTDFKKYFWLKDSIYNMNSLGFKIKSSIVL